MNKKCNNIGGTYQNLSESETETVFGWNISGNGLWTRRGFIKMCHIM